MKQEIILDVFAKRLKELMDADDKIKSIADLAKLANIPRTSINNWILKKRVPTIYSVYQIAEYFGVSIDYLTGRKDFEW